MIKLETGAMSRALRTVMSHGFSHLVKLSREVILGPSTCSTVKREMKNYEVQFVVIWCQSLYCMYVCVCLLPL